MQWHDYITTVARTKNICKSAHVPHNDLNMFKLAQLIARNYPPNVHKLEGHLRDAEVTGFTTLHYEFDYCWIQENRPYYLVYPSVMEMLSKLSLDKVLGNMIRMPNNIYSLVVKFAVGHEFCGQVKNVWIITVPSDENGRWTCIAPHFRHLYPVKQEMPHGSYLIIGIDHGDYDADGSVQHLIRCIPLTDLTIQQSIEKLRISKTMGIGKQLDIDIIDKVTSLICTLLLIGDNKDLLKPEVLTNDQNKVTDVNLQQYVDKAHKKGKIAWSVGKDIEVIPHYRRPHLAMMWTGKGRQLPKVVMRSGAIVHRQVIEDIPTGFEG